MHPVEGRQTILVHLEEQQQGCVSYQCWRLASSLSNLTNFARFLPSYLSSVPKALMTSNDVHVIRAQRAFALLVKKAVLYSDLQQYYDSKADSHGNLPWSKSFPAGQHIWLWMWELRASWALHSAWWKWDFAKLNGPDTTLNPKTVRGKLYFSSDTVFTVMIRAQKVMPNLLLVRIAEAPPIFWRLA